jgi:hypothetical protein
MTQSRIHQAADRTAVEITSARENGEKSVEHPFRPLVPHPLKPAGPVIAGGIIRFGLGRTESDEP